MTTTGRHASRSHRGTGRDTGGDTGTGAGSGSGGGRPGSHRLTRTARPAGTLLAVSLATFMLLLDLTVVNVALPDIQRSLGASFSDLQWVVDAYALTLAALLLTAGVLSDRHGRRGAYLVGVGVFTLASLVCGLAHTPAVLIVARGVQGVGGAAMFATSTALLAETFTGRARAAAFGIYGAVLGGAVAIGPLVGGAITTGLGWRWIFLINLPIGIACIVVTLVSVAVPRRPRPPRLDLVGCVTFSGALFLLVAALVQGNTHGWTSPPIVAGLAGAGVLLVAFVVVELRSDHPMLDLGLFRRPAMTGMSLGAFTLSGSIFAMFLFLILFMEEVLGLSPLQAGVRFLPVTLLAFVTAPVAGKLTATVPSRVLLAAGLGLVALGCFLMAHVRPDSSWTVLLPGFVAGGIGVGLTNPVVASGSVAVVEPARSGMASGASGTFRQVGFATSVAACGAVFLAHVQASTTRSLEASALGRRILATAGDRIGEVVTSGSVREATAGLPGPVRTTIVDAYRSGFSGALDDILLIAAAVALVGAVGAAVLVRQRDFVSLPSLSGPAGESTPTPTAPAAATTPTPTVPPRPRPLPVPDLTHPDVGQVAVRATPGLGGEFPPRTDPVWVSDAARPDREVPGGVEGVPSTVEPEPEPGPGA